MTKINLYLKGDKSILLEYNALHIPRKHERVSFILDGEEVTFKVDDIKYNIKENKIYDEYQINYVDVIVKEIVTNI